VGYERAWRTSKTLSGCRKLQAIAAQLQDTRVKISHV